MKETCESGILAGYPVIDLRATLVDGSYHDVDSSEMAFKIAGSMAIKEAVKAGPVLLEPMMKVEVEVPENFLGDVMGDLNSRRGQIEGMGSGGCQSDCQSPIGGDVWLPQISALKTQGRGLHNGV